MKHPKIQIFTSSPLNIEYYIYRFKNKLPDISIDQLVSEYEPIGRVKEYNNQTTNKSIKNYKMRDIEYDDKFTVLSTPFDFNYNTCKYSIDFKNDNLAIHHKMIEVEMANWNIIKINIYENNVLKNTYVNSNDIEKIIKINSYNSVFISNSFMCYNSISLNFEARIIEIIDNGFFIGNTGKGAANGLYDPIIKTLETKDYIEFYQEKETQKNTYYYRVVGKRTDAFITELSNLAICEIAESKQVIEATLESTEDYDSKDPTWVVVESKNLLTNLKASKDKKEMVCSKIDSLKKEDIYLNDDLIHLENIREIKIKNIWNKENRKCMLRNKKVFRVKNSIGDIETEYSDVIKFDDKVEVLIDKITILRRRVDILNKVNDEKPILFTDANSEILKVFVRQGGRYVKDFYMTDSSMNNIADKEIGDDYTYKISYITLDSRFPFLNVKDSCNPNYIYNYTIYLHDELGEISEPITIIK